jgi:hypothetical protein
MEMKGSVVHIIPRRLLKDFASAQLVRAHSRWDRLIAEKNAEQVSLFKTLDKRGEYKMVLGVGVAGREFQLRYRRMRQTPPAEVEFVLFMLSRERRQDVLADLDDWYSSWCEKFGPKRAKFLCWWKVACCVGAAVLEVMGRVGEFISKVAPK